MSEAEQTAQKVQAMLEVMWKNNRAIIAERVRTLRAAQQSLAEGALDRIKRKDTESAAHKLAGILGTFGLPEGSALARKIDQLMAQEGGIDQQQQHQLGEWLDDLERCIDSKDNGPR
jgi:HPt (histidine-containing phosphotransfer) domain-containing protein